VAERTLNLSSAGVSTDFDFQSFLIAGNAGSMLWKLRLPKA